MSMSDEEFDALHEKAHEVLGWAVHNPEVITASIGDEEVKPENPPLAVMYLFEEGTIQLMKPDLSLEKQEELIQLLMNLLQDNAERFRANSLINSALN